MGDTFGIGKVMDSIRQNTTDAILEVKPEAMTEHAEQKLVEIKAFRREIRDCLAPIIDQLETVKAKFSGKAFNEELEQSEGILTGAFVDYIECV